MMRNDHIFRKLDDRSGKRSAPVKGERSTPLMRHRMFGRNEDGQVLLIGAILALALLGCALVPIPVGQAITSKIRAQNAADAAAMASMRWTARGSNMMQGLNGFLWDSDYVAIQAIIATAAYWIGKWGVDCGDCADSYGIDIPACYRCAWGDHSKGTKAVKKAIQAQKDVASAIAGVETTVANAVPYLAYLHANQLAGDCGADVFNPSDIAPSLTKQVPVLGTLLQQVGTLIQQAAQILGSAAPRCWTLSFNLWPPSNHQFCKKASPSSEWKSPLHTTLFVPFSALMSPPLLMFNFKGWKNDWYESINVDKTVTYVTTIDSQEAFSFNNMFLTDADRQKSVTNLVAGISAFGSAVNTGDKLYESGIKDPVYWATPVESIEIKPPPGLRVLGIGEWYYGGQFKAETKPVQVMSLPGTVFLMFH